jgi:hypothetical protein
MRWPGGFPHGGAETPDQLQLDFPITSAEFFLTKG